MPHSTRRCDSPGPLRFASRAAPLVATLATALTPLVAHAELPRALAIQGRLTNAGGAAATDGTYALTWRLYGSAAPDAPVLWTAVDPTVTVLDGVFSAVVGDEPGAQALPTSAFSGALWLGVSVAGEPELPRTAMLPVPQALYAEAAGVAALALSANNLACTGCVGADDLADGAVDAKHLSSSARALFLSASGGTVSGAVTVTGGLDLDGSVLSDARLATGDVAGKACGPADLGRVVVDSATSRLHWCNGATYLRIATCTGTCRDPAAVACGTLITTDCGDLSATCTGKGSGCPAGQLCGASGCFNDGSSALSPAVSCRTLHESAPTLPSATYWIDPDGAAGLAPFQVPCDMTTEGGGWTVIQYAADLPFQNYFTSGDAYRYVPADFTTVLSKAQIAAIQAVSTQGLQTYVGLCDNVVHYFYTADGTYAYAFGFKFLDGSETTTAAASYSPYDILVTQDGCKANGGENGSLAQATQFVIRSTKVPVINVKSRDSGDVVEKFGSPLTNNPARLR